MVNLSDKAQRGLNTIKEMLGEEVASELHAVATSEKFGAALTRLALEQAYGDAWNETGLSRREKSLITISALIAARQPKELENHVRLGLKNGIDARELESLLVQLVPYVGFPAVSAATTAIRRVLRSGDREQP